MLPVVASARDALEYGASKKSLATLRDMLYDNRKQLRTLLDLIKDQPEGEIGSAALVQGITLDLKQINDEIANIVRKIGHGEPEVAGITFAAIYKNPVMEDAATGDLFGTPNEPRSITFLKDPNECGHDVTMCLMCCADWCHDHEFLSLTITDQNLPGELVLSLYQLMGP